MIELVPVRDTDVATLRSVHAAVCGEQFTALRLPAATLQQLVDTQFDAQNLSYRTQRPDSVDHLIVVDGEVAGRLWIDQSDVAVHVLDIAVIPAMRRRGIAHSVMVEVISVAADRVVTLEVWNENPGARALYDSLGFVVEADSDAHVSLRREPDRELAR